MKYILLALLAYVLYQFIFKLVVPIYQTTQKIKKGFGEMQDRMEEQMKQQRQAQSNQSATTPSPKEPKTKAGEYIEFEEVK
ncbi:MAG: hypothetical protein R2796_07455 [Chitinophagaceae bacterium]|nr:hypothetical protein [Chitinophagaceae bacterium]MCB0740950.1 hypothetical protein [Chitinophagaceae bacterium]HQU56140.1 hypothetical protein [Chitinophagaceae bacterium]HQV05973.1 hypothetical protein [Chitinophagaceae bacterium]